MNFTAKDVAALREQTGVGMMDCKKALVETGGDMKKAADYLRKQGMAVAAKKAGRIAAEGAIACAVSKDFLEGCIVEVNCESDFVAKSEGFLGLCKTIAEVALKEKPKSVEELNKKKAGAELVEELIINQTAKIGEKLALRRFNLQSVKKGRQEVYIHGGGKIGVLLSVETDSDLNKSKDFVSMCHDVAMQVAAMNPKFVSMDTVPKEDIAKEKDIFIAQVLKEGKPPAIAEKMVEGKVRKFFKELCLLDQEFFKDSTKTVAKFVEETEKKLSAKITIAAFTRFERGEGIEKKVDNLAEEVAKMSK